MFQNLSVVLDIILQNNIKYIEMLRKHKINCIVNIT